MLVLAACGDTPRPPSRGSSAPATPPLDLATGDAIPAGRMPVAVAVGLGSVWVADGATGTVLRIDPGTRHRVGPAIPAGPAPFALAIGAGAVWVADQTGDVRAIDPVARSVSGRIAHVAGANGLAVGLGGVWVTSRIAGTVTRIDPRTRRADPPIRVGAGPADVVIADGAVWVANAAAGTISRVLPGASRADPPIRVGGQLLALAAGDGALWAGRAGGKFAQTVQVVRVDPRARRVTGQPVTVPGAIPLDLAVGASGIWATGVGGLRPPRPPLPGTVTRIDPAGPTRVGSPLKTGNRPVAVAVGAGLTWVANAGDGTVTPIGPLGRGGG